MDKVIIDGVDVSGCEHFGIDNMELCKINFDNNYFSNGIPCAEKCNKHPNCYYKQLQRAKAENEELKKELEKHKSKIGHLLSPLTDSDFQDKLKELEQENERLKENQGRCAFKSLDNTFCPEADKKITELELSRDSYKVSYETAKKYREKAEQCLQEIRGIAEKPKPFRDFSEIKTATEVGYDYASICNELELRLHKVLELITEVEEE